MYFHHRLRHLMFKAVVVNVTVIETRTGVSVQAWQAVAEGRSTTRCSNTTETVSARAADATADIRIPRCFRSSQQYAT